MPTESRVRLWLRACLFAALLQLAVGLARMEVASNADQPGAEQALFLVERGPGFVVAFPLVAVVSRAFAEPLLTLRQLIYPASAIATWLIYSLVIGWLLGRGGRTAAKLEARA